MPETNLNTLLRSMNPVLHKDKFVYCSLSEVEFKSLELIPTCTFRETEGVTVILEKSLADALNLPYTNCWALISCKINSDLTAVGFLAAMSSALANDGIAVNAISAYYHDHLFVQWENAERAMELLRCLSQK